MRLIANGLQNCRVEIEDEGCLDVVHGDLTVRMAFSRHGGPHSQQSVVISAEHSSPKVGAQPGERMMDGTIYAGISPNNGKAMFTTQADADVLMNFDEAKLYARGNRACGYDDWRVPRISELEVLFNHRVSIGGFYQMGTNPGGWYLSSTELGNGTALLRGVAADSICEGTKGVELPVRLVR